ncbi:MAG: hypothetical protein HY905_18635 [Deltaproteobacteria bacterium]|nr:hypothetical protein [Deltaproteobacteria bacterium]
MPFSFPPPGNTVHLVLAALAFAAGCGPRTAEPAAGTSTTAGAATSQPVDATSPADSFTVATVFGVPLGADAETIATACPGLAPAPDPAALSRSTMAWTTTVEGIPVEINISWESGRVAVVALDLVGEAATEANFRTLQARAQADLGLGHSTRCESEDGVPFDEYLAHGWGGLKIEWRDPPFAWTGELALTKDYGPEGLRIRGFFVVPSLLPADDFADEGFVDGVVGTTTRTFTARAAGGPAPNRTAGFRPRLGPAQPRAEARGSDMVGYSPVGDAKQSAECTVDLSAAPGATILGLPFGASQKQVEEILGRPLTSANSELYFLRDVDGTPGRVHLSFYDGCLAVVLFLVDGDAATADAYRRLREWSRIPMGAGDGVSCTSEDGVPDEEHIAAGYGYLHTGWRGGEPLEGSLRLERSYSERGGLQLVFEADYIPLREHAPQIDFSPDAAGASTPQGPAGASPLP